MLSIDHIVQAPIRVRWLGWDSDTYTLKKTGWSVFANEDYLCSDPVLTLALRAPGEAFMILGRIDLREMRFRREPNSFLKQLCDSGIDMQLYRATDLVRRLPFVQAATLARWDSLAPVDPIASIPEMFPLGDLKIFKYQAPTEIYIPSTSVDECLDRILQLQYPKQQLIKEANTRPIVKATVWSVAE